MAENVNEKLFSEFAPNTTQEWKDKVIADLKSWFGEQTRDSTYNRCTGWKI